MNKKLHDEILETLIVVWTKRREKACDVEDAYIPFISGGGGGGDKDGAVVEALDV